MSSNKLFCSNILRILEPIPLHSPLAFDVLNDCRVNDGMCLSTKINIFKKKVPTGKAVATKDSAVFDDLYIYASVSKYYNVIGSKRKRDVKD